MKREKRVKSSEIRDVAECRGRAREGEIKIQMRMIASELINISQAWFRKHLTTHSQQLDLLRPLVCEEGSSAVNSGSRTFLVF